LTACCSLSLAPQPCGLAYLLLTEGLSAGWQLLLLIPFWVVVTYLMLPRLHRILTRV